MREITREPHAVHLIEEELMKGEEIHWVGQPEMVLFGLLDIFYIPLWTVISFGCAAGIIGIVRTWLSGDITSSVAGCLILLVPLSLLCVYTMVGRFIQKYWTIRNTYFAVTNLRALEITTVPRRSLKAAFLNTVPAISKSVKSDGVGTITFELPGSMPEFSNIQKANHVYQLLAELRSIDDPQRKCSGELPQHVLNKQLRRIRAHIGCTEVLFCSTLRRVEYCPAQVASIDASQG